MEYKIDGMTLDGDYIEVTAENIAAWRHLLAEEHVNYMDGEMLIIGYRSWPITYDGGQRGQMGEWPNGRGYIATGGDNAYGDWTDGELVLDEQDMDGNTVYVDQEGVSRTDDNEVA